MPFSVGHRKKTRGLTSSLVRILPLYKEDLLIIGARHRYDIRLIGTATMACSKLKTDANIFRYGIIKMNSELLSITVLIAIIVLSTISNINIGIIAFIATWAVGAFVWKLSMATILDTFPSDTIMLLIAVGMYSGLFKETKTGEWIVDKIIFLTKGKLWFIPWVLFFVALLLTSISMGIIFMIPICSTLVNKYKINPMLITAMTLCGAQTGSFSPLSHYGIITKQIVSNVGLSIDSWCLFILVVLFNLFVGLLSFSAFGGFLLIKQPNAIFEGKVHNKIKMPQTLCLMSLPCLAILFFAGVDVSVALFIICVLLSFVLKFENRPAMLLAVPWSVVMLVAGLMMYVGILEISGTIEWLSTTLTQNVPDTIAGFFLCLATALISYFASSLGSIGAMLPLATPMMLSGQISTIGACAAIGVCATIVDISPFSAYGALMLTMVDEEEHQVYNKFRLTMIIYGGILAFAGPFFAWLLFWVLNIG